MRTERDEVTCATRPVSPIAGSAMEPRRNGGCNPASYVGGHGRLEVIADFETSNWRSPVREPAQPDAGITDGEQGRVAYAAIYHPAEYAPATHRVPELLTALRSTILAYCSELGLVPLRRLRAPRLGVPVVRSGGRGLGHPDHLIYLVLPNGRHLRGWLPFVVCRAGLRAARYPRPLSDRADLGCGKLRVNQESERI
jgi:hypothetical protein